jgi:hypothetical protein
MVFLKPDAEPAFVQDLKSDVVAFPQFFSELVLLFDRDGATADKNNPVNRVAVSHYFGDVISEL